MSPELYFAVMLITNPQKTRRILLAEELENWFMDMFDDEYEDILNGSFVSNQSFYIERMIDKYLDIAKVDITNTDTYSKQVIERATQTATEIQETTLRNIVYPTKTKTPTAESARDRVDGSDREKESDNEVRELILSGIALSATLISDEIKRFLGNTRANLIALNESNWVWNTREYFDATETKKTKTWHTALDEKVRLAHMEVEGVEKPIDEPFIVGGFPMLYPLDSSGGAPLSLIANCRCTVEYK